jgi:hypothetical protein
VLSKSKKKSLEEIRKLWRLGRMHRNATWSLWHTCLAVDVAKKALMVLLLPDIDLQEQTGNQMDGQSDGNASSI